MLFFGDGTEESFVTFPVAGVDAIVAYLLEMFFRDMLYETVYEIESRNRFHDQAVILVTVIVEGDHVTVIFINTGGGNDGPAKIAADVFSNDLRVTFIGFCMDIKTVFMVSVDGGFYFFERRADAAFQFIQKSGLESIP